jgi:hypothetical protein
MAMVLYMMFQKSKIMNRKYLQVPVDEKLLQEEDETGEREI